MPGGIIVWPNLGINHQCCSHGAEMSDLGFETPINQIKPQKITNVFINVSRWVKGSLILVGLFLGDFKRRIIFLRRGSTLSPPTAGIPQMSALATEWSPEGWPLTPGGFARGEGEQQDVNPGNQGNVNPGPVLTVCQQHTGT